MGAYVVTAIVLVVYLALAWFAGTLLKLTGASLWILRGGLALIGFVSAGIFLWFHRKMQREKSGGAAAPATGMASQIDLLLLEAERKLKVARNAPASKIGNLPVIFLLGEPNSAKTSVMLHCGLEPELLAGHVYSDAEVVPTAVVNIWFARNALFIDVGGAVASDPQAWARLVQRTRPGQIASALGKGQLAPRAVVVCCECERLAGGGDAVAAMARRLGSRLQEMANLLGATFPVYALFTKMDRVPHFLEYVSNLTSEESGQVLGATLKRRTGSDGLFAEEESNRLTKAFDQLVYSLAEKRLDYLSREAAPERLPDVYEFPREMRKVRNLVVQFLVELSRPSQLGSNSFLRGFYFSGVRPVVVNESVATAASAPPAANLGGTEATRMFTLDDRGVAPPPTASGRVVQSRKIPEWSFLPHLFNEVILRDRSALAASGHSSRVDALRRGLLIAAAAVFFCLTVAFLISFFNNRSLEGEVEQSAVALAKNSNGVTASPSLDQLKLLDQLRMSVVELAAYRKDGAPFSYRFGLYAGDRIEPDARRIYFAYFRPLLLASTQAAMLSNMRQPPATLASDDFQQVYSTLKAYLITTSHHEKADWATFVPVLLDRSPAFRSADSDSQALIRKQFAFYAGELAAANPFASDEDTAAVERARAYLRQFSGVEAVYQAMLDDASKGKSPVIFGREFPTAATVVVDAYTVPAAFTRDGFAAMQKSLANPDKFRGEEWVLGPQAGSAALPPDLQSQLTRRYDSEYLNHWRQFLKAARVQPYSSLKDASGKLSRLVANDSPLLQLFWLAKDNTAVDIPEGKGVFDSVQGLEAGSARDRLMVDGNRTYMGALSQLQAAVSSAADAPNPDPASLGPVTQAASGAKAIVTSIAQNFPIDTQGRTDAQVKELLQEPIVFVETAVRGAGGAPAEAACQAVNAVTAKFPFNANSSQQASIQEVQDLFRPQSGTLWALYDARLKPLAARQGSNFVSTGAAPLAPSFLAFLGRAQQFTDALFPNNSPGLHLGYTLRQLPTSGIDQLSLTIDGQAVNGSGQSTPFVWSGAENSTVVLTATAAGQPHTLNAQGSWAPFQLFLGANTFSAGSPATLEWQLQLQTQFGHTAMTKASQLSVRYELQTQGAMVFRKEFLAGLHCVAR